MMTWYFFFTFVLSIVSITTSTSYPCNQRTIDDSHSVCVCNSDYCDTVPPLSRASGTYELYTTSKAQLGFSKTGGNFSTISLNTCILNCPPTIKINRILKYQKITGFGGAFTDAAALNILSLPEAAKEKLLQSYFGEDGLGNSLCRVPIGGTDFSTRAYSYDDHPGDVNLDQWALQQEDLEYKVSVLKSQHFKIPISLDSHHSRGYKSTTRETAQAFCFCLELSSLDEN